MPNLILLSGPSCVGKSPLFHAYCRLMPGKSRHLEKVILYNDRAPRPGERDGLDYHFRSRAEIEGLKNQQGYMVVSVRNDLQALELDAIQRILDRGHHAFYEGAPYIVTQLIKRKITQQFPTTTIFMSPLCKEEIQFLSNPERNPDFPGLVTGIMRKKLLRRKQKQMGILSAPDLEDIEIRCQAAYRELQEAYKYQYVIPNHNGEDSENWAAFPYPVGDALQSVWDFDSILENNPRPRIEHWEEDLLPPGEKS